MNYSILTFKSKVYYPSLLLNLLMLTSNFIQAFSSQIENSQNIQLINFNSLKILNILIDKSDHCFFNSRVELLKDESKNLNNENCLNYSEQIDKTSISSIIHFLNTINLEKDDDILEFFGTIILLYHYKELGLSIKEDLIINRFSLLPISKSRNSKESNEILNNSTNASFNSQNFCTKKDILPLSKSLLKPYNKETILKQENCVVDYGGKFKSKKMLAERDKYLIETVEKANKDFYEAYENDVRNCNLEKSVKKVKFHFTIEQITNKDL